MRGLDRDERHCLDVIGNHDFDADFDMDAARRCAKRMLFTMITKLCENCGDVHSIPVLTAEGKTAIVCDEASRTLEF